MAFDFRKEYKEFYMPKSKPEIVNVPKANYIAVRGKGNPNEEGGAYQQAIGVLMDDFLKQNGYVNDMNETRLHHEIYLSDARKVAPQKWKTVIRHPIRMA